MTADALPIRGKTLTRISGIEEDEVRFHCSDGEIFRMYHHQDCCESVGIEQIDGDIADLIGVPLLTAEVVFQRLVDDDEGLTGWTFYKFATIRGYVTIRWSGSSNGYYSVGVDFKNEKDCYDY